MKSHRFQYSYRRTASLLHRTVGNALRAHPLFSGHQIYQEYPVERIAPEFKLKGCHFDWVVLDLKLVIEAHGAQHYTPTAFDGNKAQAQSNLEDIQERDEAKMWAAVEAGFAYMIVKYDEQDKVTGDMLWDRYAKLLALGAQVCQSTKTTAPKQLNPWYNKEKARAYRQEQYARAKQWRKDHVIERPTRRDNADDSEE
jgi:very-short-patch-repair endonuclease